MPDRSMRGIYPILSMPFDKDGNIVFEDLRNEVEWAIGHGVHGLGAFVCAFQLCHITFEPSNGALWLAAKLRFHLRRCARLGHSWSFTKQRMQSEMPSTPHT